MHLNAKESTGNSPVGRLPWLRSGGEAGGWSQQLALVGGQRRAGAGMMHEAGSAGHARGSGGVEKGDDAAAGRVQAGAARVRALAYSVLIGVLIGARIAIGAEVRRITMSMYRRSAGGRADILPHRCTCVCGLVCGMARWVLRLTPGQQQAEGKGQRPRQ